MVGIVADFRSQISDFRLKEMVGLTVAFVESMDQLEMKRRTKDLGKRVIALCRQLPDSRESRLIGNQLFRSATAVGSNYRAACRGRSKADFIAKLGVVLEEADETLYWLELVAELAIMRKDRLTPLLKEADELVAILVVSLNTAKRQR